VLDYRSPGLRRPRRVRSLAEELCKLAGLGSLFVIYGLEGDREKPIDAFFVAGALLWIFVLAAYVMRHVRGRPRFPTERGWALATVAMLGIVLSWLPFSFRNYHSCPHGERWANNQIGIARSYNGGPCGNGSRARGTYCWHVSGPWYIYIPMRY
jgi:hypothetical protein